jgi:hypothetical protein
LAKSQRNATLEARTGKLGASLSKSVAAAANSGRSRAADKEAFMLRKGRTRLAAALALVAALAAAPASAGTSGRAAGGAWPDLGRLWEWAQSWLALATRITPQRVTAAACDDSSSIDPNGCPRAQGSTDSGSTADGDSSSSIDPDG